ncbi:MAG: translation initiation factor IF-6 [Candidatus Lokiarchaeota archaeon]|nr:translation initiation factor IF-6 [Candidatus Lokiarchaeota archaeon]
MTILKAQIFGGSLIGVYLEANNSYLLHPPDLIDTYRNRFKKVFEIDFYPITINNSRLVGVYSKSNSHGIILPSIIREDELNRLEIISKEREKPFEIGTLECGDNTFGNLILCNDKGAIISSLLKEQKKKISEILNVETVIFDFAGSCLPGSIGIANNKGCLVHPMANDDEIDFISSILKVETDVSTINRGIPYLSSGAVVNDNSGIFGSFSTGPEMMRLTNVLQL